MTNHTKSRAFSTEAYFEMWTRIEHLARQAERVHPLNPSSELANLLDIECLDQWSAVKARDLAKFAGARLPHLTGAWVADRRAALEVMASEWIRVRALWRSSATSRRCVARLAIANLKRRAYANGRSYADQRDAERREREVSMVTIEARTRSTESLRRTVIAFIFSRGNAWIGAAS